MKTVGTLIVSRASSHAILVQYESERRKYAQELIDFDKQFAALFSGKPQAPEKLDGLPHEQVIKYAFFLCVSANI